MHLNVFKLTVAAVETASDWIGTSHRVGLKPKLLLVGLRHKIRLMNPNTVAGSESGSRVYLFSL